MSARKVNTPCQHHCLYSVMKDNTGYKSRPQKQAVVPREFIMTKDTKHRSYASFTKCPVSASPRAYCDKTRA